MVELPGCVRPLFMEAGWFPERREPTSDAVPADHPAVAILAGLGGLTVRPHSSTGKECGTMIIRFRMLPIEDASTRTWADLLDARLVGIADLGDGHAGLYIADDGRCFFECWIDDAFGFVAEDFASAVERILTGQRIRPMLRPDQSSIDFYGVPFTADSPELYRYRRSPTDGEPARGS